MMAALPPPHQQEQEQEQTSPVRETAILFDWDSHRVFPGVQVTTDSPPLNLSNAPSARSTSPAFGSPNPTPDPLSNFRGPLAGVAIYNPALPPVHWYLEPAGQSYLPLTNRRATELVADAFQPQFGLRLTLVFPAALPSDTREVTLGIPGAHAAFVLRISSALPTTPSSAYEVVDILMYLPVDRRLLAVRIKIPTIAALAVKGVNMAVESRYGTKQFTEVERIASMAVMHNNRMYMALPGYHFPYILAVFNDWEGTSSVPSSWKSKVDYLVESINYMAITENLRSLGNWFCAAPTHMDLFHLDKHTFVASLSPDGVLRILNAHSLKIAMDAPLLPTKLASSTNKKQDKLYAASFHVHSAPGTDYALVAVRTNLGTWYSAKMTLAAADGSTPVVIDEFAALPSLQAALGGPDPSAASFASATWLSDTVLVAEYKNVDRSTGTFLIGINLATQPTAAWARMPTATTQRTANGSSAVHRALRAFCAEYHVHATAMTAAAADPGLYMTEVAKAYTMMYPHMALEATIKGIEEYVSRALALDTETVTVVRVAAPVPIAAAPADNGDVDMDQDGHQQAADVQVDLVASEAQLNAGMLLVIKRAGFSVVRQSTPADAMVDALGMAIQRPDRYTHAIAGVTPTFADAWAIADAATLAAVTQMGGASLDAAVRRGADALVAQSFSEAILGWVNGLNDEVLNAVQNLQMWIMADAGVKEVAHTISAALDALAANASPAAGTTSATTAGGGIAVPHIVVPLLHDLLVDQQNLARAIVQVSLLIKTLAGSDRNQRVSPKLVLDRVLDLFRMPDLLVSEAMPLLTLTQHAPLGARVDVWAAGQLASAMARAREWTPVERTKFVMYAPAPAVAALLDAQDPESAPGKFLHALRRVVAEWQRGGSATGEAAAGVKAVLDALLEALQKEAQALEPLVRTEWLLLGETAAVCMLDRGMHAVAGKVFDGVASLLVNESLRAELQKNDESMHTQVQTKTAQLLGQAFSAYLQAGNVHQAIVVLTAMNEMPETVMPKAKVKNRVAHLVDRMDPAHVAIHPMHGLKDYVIDTVKAKLAMLLQKVHGDGHIGLTPRGLPVVVGMYDERANVYEMLWRLHAADEEMNALEAGKYAYYQARALWGATCAVASRVGVVVEDASGHGVEDWSRMDEVHEWAQMTLRALGEAHAQLMAVTHKSFRMVLVHQNELTPHIGKTFAIHQKLIMRMFDEISLACILHQVHGKSWYLRGMAAAGLPSDADREDGGQLLRHDPSRLKDLIVAIKECGDPGKAKDMMLKYADDVRSATGYDTEWLQEPARSGFNSMA